ncbi:alpha/beta hydrolase [Prolixibacter bellariivorans]|uniref:Alpha/beta hydrolase n=1 Tax=Prolixibacter bellariivorans TaxID=314319 RepID=A0A5M4AXS6_9BACT|nr:alpha/beta hydrolase [Prolixibacter bellariivorans]GET32719.1 alpha/beta hydrolase [Prolixibacter bellariivorans]
MNQTQLYHFSTGRKLSYSLSGKGELLVLLHGYLESSAIFDDLLPELSSHFQILTVDFPGHGHSDLPPEGYTFLDFAKELYSLLEEIGHTDQLTLAGHSMGGYNALAFASLFPEKVKWLALLHASADEASESHVNMRRREMGLIEKGRLELIIRNSLHNNFAPCNRERFPELHYQLREMASRVSPEAAIAAIRAIMGRPSYLEFLNTAPFPALIIAGEEDKILAAAKQWNEAHHIRNATYVGLENCGHVGFIEEKSLFLEKFLNFSVEQPENSEIDGRDR